MASRFRKGLRIFALLIALAALVVGLGLVPLNLFFLKDALAEQVREQAGLNLHIAGALRARLGFRPAVEAASLTLSLPDAARPSLVEIDSLAIAPRLFDLLRGRFHFRSIRIAGADFDYCPAAWPRAAFTDDGSPPGSPPLGIDSLEVTDLRLRCEKPEHALRFLSGRIDIEASAPPGRDLSIEAGGALADGPMRLSLRGGPLSRLLDGEEPWRFAAALEALSGDLRVDARLGQPLQMLTLDAEVELTLGDPALALDHFGLEAPQLRPLRLAGRVGVEAGALRFYGMEGALGDNGFALSGSIAGLSGRPRFELAGRLDELDLGLRGQDTVMRGPNDGAGTHDLGPLLDFLDGVDGRLTVRVGRISGVPIDLTDLVVDAQVENGRAQVDDARLMVGTGSLTGTASLDIRADCPALAVQAGVRDLDVSELAAWTVPQVEVGGQVGQATIDASSCGRSAPALLDALRLQATVENVVATYDGEPLPIAVSQLEVEGAWRQPGRTVLAGSLLGERLLVEASLGSMATILDGEAAPLNLSARGGGATLQFDGRAAFPEGIPVLDGAVALAAGRIGALHRWLGVPEEGGLALAYRSELKTDAQAVRLVGVDARIGNSDVRGDVSWSEGAPIVLKLASDRLDTRELSALLQAEPDGAAQRPAAARRDDGTDEPWNERLGFAAMDIDLQVAELTGRRYDFGNVEMRARLRDRLIEDGKLTVELGERAADFEFDLDFRTAPWRLGGAAELRKVDLAALLASLGFETEIEAAAEHVRLEYRSTGGSPRELLENSSLSGRVEGADWWFESGPEASRHHLTVESLEMAAARDASWTWRGRGTLDDVPLRAWLESPSLAAAFDVGQPLPLSMVLDSEGGILRLEAVLRGRGSDVLDADLDISGAWAHPPVPDLSAPDLGLDDYRLKTALSVYEGSLGLSDLDLRIGASRITGGVELTYLDPGYLLRADLASPFLETDDLAQAAAHWRSARPLHRPSEDAPATPGGDARGGLIELLSRALDNVIANHRLDVSADVAELHSGGNALGHGRFSARSEASGFRADLTIGAPDGDITAVYETGSTGDTGFTLSAHAERFEYGGLARLFVPGSELSGQLHLDAELTSPDADPATAVHQLEGYLDLAVFPRNVAADGLDLWASNLVLALLRFGAESTKQLNCGVARFEVAEGVMKTRQAFLDTTDIIVRARGSIDLAENEIDLWIAPQAKVERFLSISAPLVVTGPLNGFSVGVPPSGFLATMFRWFYGVIYVPWKWLTGERFPADGIATCYRAMDWEYPGPSSFPERELKAEP